MEKMKKLASFRTAVLAGCAAMGLSGLSQSAKAATIITNFGNNAAGTDATGRYYNSITTVSSGPFALNDTTNTSTGVSLTITNLPGTAFTNSSSGNTAYTNGFNTFNFGGTTSTTGAAATLGYSSAATSSSGYGNTTFYPGSGNNQVPDVELVLSGLNPALTYGFDIFASRAGVGDVRSADYNISGGALGTASTSLELDAANNTANYVAASGFTPDANGDITIIASPDATNTNSNHFYYLGVLQINSSPVPEPASMTGILLGGAALLRRGRRIVGTEL
jgi:hypothetical protein